VSLSLKRRPKSPYWIIRGTLRGIRVEESTGTSNKRAAEEIRAKREAEILEGSIYGHRATATFATAALSYLENGGSRRFTASVISYFGTTPLARTKTRSIEVQKNSIPMPCQQLATGSSIPWRHRYCTTRRSADGARSRSLSDPPCRPAGFAGLRSMKQTG